MKKIVGVISMEIEIIPIHNGINRKANYSLRKTGEMIRPSELELDGIDGRNTDIEVEARLSNHSAPDEYRDADRAGGCDVLKRLRKQI